jgi:hypothetical protein
LGQNQRSYSEEVSPSIQKWQVAIETNNPRVFQNSYLSTPQLLALRLKHSMNVLQAAAYYSAENVINYLLDKLRKSPNEMKELVEYKEPLGGNQALHFAVLKGNHRIVNVLVKDFKASPKSITENGLSILHCAAQFERGTLSLELFLD